MINEPIIGRKSEQAELMRCYNSTRAEFVIIYGRRRVGKTFLVNHTLGQHLSFYYTGSHSAPKHRQLLRFAEALHNYGLPQKPVLKDWYDAMDGRKQ